MRSWSGSFELSSAALITGFQGWTLEISMGPDSKYSSTSGLRAIMLNALPLGLNSTEPAMEASPSVDMG